MISTRATLSLLRVVTRSRRAERLRTRTSNPYGKDPAQIAETLEYLETVEPLLREAATLEVVTTVPVGQVADMVVAYCL